MIERLRVGAISNTHGIKGEVKVFPTTDDVSRFNKLKKVILDTGKEDIELEIEGVKFFKQFAILKFKGFDNINEVEKYKGMDLYINRTDAVKLKKDEYFVGDLVGLRVITDTDDALGTVKDVLFTGANDVYVVLTEQGKEVLLPAIKQCILDINVEERFIKVHLMEGLID